MNARICAMLVAAAGLSTSALAGTVHVQLAGSPYQGGGGGGGFLITQLTGYNGQNGGPGAGANQFITFCLEENEYFYPGRDYTTALSSVAHNGGVGHGVGGTPTSDPIDEITAVIYWHFRNGGNFGLSGPWTAARTTGLQRAIWFQENEITSLGSAEAIAIHNWGVANAQAGNFHGVRVMNMNEMPYNRNYPDGILGGRAQDFLTIDPVTIVPLPAQALSGLAGICMIAVSRRRPNR